MRSSIVQVMPASHDPASVHYSRSCITHNAYLRLVYLLVDNSSHRIQKNFLLYLYGLSRFLIQSTPDRKT